MNHLESFGSAATAAELGAADDIGAAAIDWGAALLDICNTHTEARGAHTRTQIQKATRKRGHTFNQKYTKKRSEFPSRVTARILNSTSNAVSSERETERERSQYDATSTHATQCQNRKRESTV